MTKENRYVIILKSGQPVTNPNSLAQNLHPFFFNLASLKVFLLRWTGGNAGWLEGATVEIWENKSEYPISVIRDKALTGGNEGMAEAVKGGDKSNA